jgi:hypothetical protein
MMKVVMPRPAGSSFFCHIALLILPIAALTAINTAASQQSQPAPASEASSLEAFGGIWVINRDLGDAPGAATVPGDAAGAGRREGPGGGGGGRMGRGGQGRGGGGRGAGAGSEDPGQREAVVDYVRTSMESSKQLTIVVHDASVSITDAEGRVTALATDGKKISGRAQNGLVKITQKNHWDNGVLVSEIEIENGPKIVRNYTLSPGGTQLRVSTTADGSGPKFNLTRVYERPVESR